MPSQLVTVVVVGEVDPGRGQPLGDRPQLRREALHPAGFEVVLGQAADGGVPAPPALVDVDEVIEIAPELVPPEVRRRDLEAVFLGHTRHVGRIHRAEGGHLHARVPGGAHPGERLRHGVGGVGMAAHRVELCADSEVVHVDSPVFVDAAGSASRIERATWATSTSAPASVKWTFRGGCNSVMRGSASA